MAAVYAVVMAGGRGERFWPLSEEARTKPFVPLLGPRTLLQQTVERLDPLVPPERVLISIGETHHRLAREQLPEIPEENFIVEPLARDTSACLGYSALHLERRDPDAVMIAIPADHYVGDAAAYRTTLERAIRSLEGVTAVVFGVRPVRPESGYGYVQARRPASGREHDPWPVVRFVEKPDRATAARYLESGDYFWNSGIFVWRNRTLLALFERHMPATYRGLCELRPLLAREGAERERRSVFAGLERLSVDFGILERSDGLVLVPVEFPWDDIGNWAALERALPADAFGNVARGAHVAVNSTGCVVYTDAGTVATFGVSDLVVVQANGKVLVTTKERAAELKRVVSALGPEHAPKEQRGETE
ncbi:MAG: mannose-1-phosphate guanylyltransferase [Acidobacteria bacterium]|nr:MAG: mannose-1-phosphate guanylyltransferase [Acidobacteriota bacterium]